jgi:hypothetical protein
MQIPLRMAVPSWRDHPRQMEQTNFSRFRLSLHIPSLTSASRNGDALKNGSTNSEENRKAEEKSKFRLTNEASQLKSSSRKKRGEAESGNVLQPSGT